MFKNDISYTNKEKSLKFTAEGKNFLVNINDALNVVK